VVSFYLVDDPTIRQPGVNLPRQQWSLLNCFRTAQGYYGVCKKLWNQAATDLCPCSEKQAMFCRLLFSDEVKWQLVSATPADDEALLAYASRAIIRQLIRQPGNGFMMKPLLG